MGNRVVLRNAIVAIAQVLLSGIILFFLYRYLLVHIGVELLGVWSLVLATTMAAKISELGFSGSVVKFVAKHIARNDSPNAVNAIETAVLTVALAFGFFAVISYFPLQLLIRQIVAENRLQDAYAILPYALISLWLNSIAGVFSSSLDGCQRVDLRGLLVIAGGLFYFGTVVLLVSKYGFIGLAYAQIAQAGFLLFFGWLLLKYEVRYLPIFPCHWHRKNFFEMWKYALNFQISSVMTLLYEPVTKALLGKFGGLAMVGYYEMANRMVLQIRSILVSANQVLVPAIASLMEKTPEKLFSVYRENYKLLFYLAVPLFSALLMFVPWISEIWVGHFESIFVISSVLLIIGNFLHILVVPAYFSNLGTGRLRWNTAAHITISVLNCLLSILMGVLFGGMGVVLAGVISLVLGSFVVLIAFHVENGIQFNILFPRESLWLTCSCCCGTGISLWLFYLYHGELGIFLLGSLNAGIFSLITMPALLFHPKTKRVCGWLNTSFSRTT